jgi:hypothetical protein
LKTKNHLPLVANEGQFGKGSKNKKIGLKLLDCYQNKIIEPLEFEIASKIK